MTSQTGCKTEIYFFHSSGGCKSKTKVPTGRFPLSLVCRWFSLLLPLSGIHTTPGVFSFSYKGNNSHIGLGAHPVSSWLNHLFKDHISKYVTFWCICSLVSGIGISTYQPDRGMKFSPLTLQSSCRYLVFVDYNLHSSFTCLSHLIWTDLCYLVQSFLGYRCTYRRILLTDLSGMIKGYSLKDLQNIFQ